MLSTMAHVDPCGKAQHVTSSDLQICQMLTSKISTEIFHLPLCARNVHYFELI